MSYACSGERTRPRVLAMAPRHRGLLLNLGVMKTKHTAQSAPARHSFGEGGFLSLCISFGILFFLAGIVLALFAATDLQPSVRDRTPPHRKQLHISEPSPVAPNGDVYEAWVARYNGTGNSYDEAIDVAVDNSGNVYVAGTSRGSGTLNDYATVKYDSAGQQQWVALYNDPSHPDEQLNAMTIDASGNVYVTGGSGTNSIPSVCTTIKYDSAGQQQWIARYSAPNGASGQAIAVDSSGNTYVSAYGSNQPNTLFCATIKYNAAGEQQWVAEYHGGSGADEPAAIVVDNAGNVYVTGTTQICQGSDYLTLKYNSAGQEQWVARYHELFEALGNDAFVIAECLARPVLIERLISDLSAPDNKGRFDSARSKRLRSVSMETTVANRAYTLPRIAEGNPSWYLTVASS